MTGGRAAAGYGRLPAAVARMLDRLARLPAVAERRRDRVRALADAGRFRDAVALGRRIDRVRPCPGFAGELRDWRHRASQAAPAPTGAANWPGRYADRWPAAPRRIPEVRPDELTPDVLGSALQHHGSLIVRGLLTARSAADHVAMIDRVFADRAAGGADRQYVPLEPANGYDMTGDRSFVGEVTVLMADAPSFLARWLDRIEDCGIVDLVSAYLGERPALSATKATLYRLPPAPGSQWHQDGAFLGRDIRTVNLWVACTECGVDAPGLELVPFRLDGIVPTGTHGSKFGWSVGEAMVDEVMGDAPTQNPHFMPGDAILFDQLCLHRTGAQPGLTRGRYAIETWMFAPSHYSAPTLLAI